MMEVVVMKVTLAIEDGMEHNTWDVVKNAINQHTKLHCLKVEHVVTLDLDKTLRNV
jgi:hypothetical protein